MGWLLISGKKKKPARKAAKSRAAREWNPQRTLRILTAVTWAVLLGGAAVSWSWAEHRLKQSISRSHREMPEIVLQKVPAWLPDSEWRKLIASLQGEIDGDPFDRAALLRAQQALEENPCVKRVSRVIRLPGGRVEVAAEYREPAALVQVGDRCHLVDYEGVKLPLVYPAEAARKLRLPVITNVAAAPPQAGDSWDGADLRAGLKLATLLQAQPWAKSVRAIDVANYGNRRARSEPQIVLLTRDGQVRWGRAPGEEQFYEPPAAQKLRNIEAVIRKSDTHTIDAGGQTVDVFGDTVLIHSAAEAEDIRYTLGQ